jgi:hypothetical protein
LVVVVEKLGRKALKALKVFKVQQVKQDQKGQSGLKDCKVHPGRMEPRGAGNQG